METLIINCLADTRITKDAIRNYLSYNFEYDSDKFFDELNRYNIRLHVRSIFGRISRESLFNHIEVEKKIAVDNGLNMLRCMHRYNIDFHLIDSHGMREELNEVKVITPPLYDMIIPKLIEL